MKVDSPNPFSEWETSTMAAQCRMQARENLDPEYSRFMEAVADRLALLPTRSAVVEECAKVDGWLPFKTALKDGTPFLVFVPDDMFRPETGQDVIWWESGQWVYGDESPFQPMNEPSHWRTLPTAPTSETPT